jgi:hypothetical protein
MPVKVKVNDNSIIFLNHKITIDDMINEMYYISNNALYNNPNIADSIYLSNLNQEDKDKFYNFREQKLHDAIKIADNINPIFKNNNISYHFNNNKIYCNLVKPFNNNNNINCINDLILYINIFYKALKFKIKQEKITKNIYNDLHITNKKLMKIENKYYEIENTLKAHEKHINKLCSCIDYIYNSNDINNSKNIIINNNYCEINNEIINIKTRQFYITIFVIILFIINIFI